MRQPAIKLCNLSKLSEGSVGFDPFGSGRDSVFLVIKNGKLYGYKDACPHYGDTTLPWKKDVYLDSNNQHITCAAHGALFEIESGLCLRGPCIGESLQPLTIEIREEDEVWMILDANEEKA